MSGGRLIYVQWIGVVLEANGRALIECRPAVLPFFLEGLRKTIKERRVGILAGIWTTELMIKSGSFSGYQRFKKAVIVLLGTLSLLMFSIPKCYNSYNKKHIQGVNHNTTVYIAQNRILSGRHVSTFIGHLQAH